VAGTRDGEGVGVIPYHDTRGRVHPVQRQTGGVILGRVGTPAEGTVGANGG